MANKHQFQAIMLAGLATVVIIIAAAAQLLYFSPMEKQYAVGGSEIIFGYAAAPSGDDPAAIKEKLLKHPLYLNLQKFGNWPPDLSKIQFLQTSPFSP